MALISLIPSMRRAYHHGDLPQQLIDAARAALVRRPDPEALSIRELARQVGVSQNAPYRHFENRRELLEAVVADGYRGLARSLASHASGGAKAVGDVWESLASREPGLVALMVGGTQGAGQRGPVLAAAREWLAEIAAAIEPEIGKNDPEQLLRRAVACWAAVLGVGALRRGGLLAGLDEWMVPTSADFAAEVVSGRRP